MLIFEVLFALLLFLLLISLIIRLGSEIQRLKTELQEAHDRANASENTTQDSFKALKKEYATIAALKKDLDKHQAKIREHQERIRVLEERLVTADQDLWFINSEQAKWGIKRENSELREALKKAERLAIEFQTEKDKYKSEFSDTATKASDATRKLAAAMTRIERLQYAAACHLYEKSRQRDEFQDEMAEKEKTIQDQDKLLDLYALIMDTLQRMACTTDDQLVAAVTFVKALQLRGISLTAIGVDLRRFMLLEEFVLAGRHSHLAVQPQNDDHRGFRLEKEPFPLTGIMVTGTQIVEGYDRHPHGLTLPRTQPSTQPRTRPSDGDADEEGPSRKRRR